MQTTFLSLKELVANVQNRLSEEEECFVFGGLDHTGHETTDNCQCNGNNCQCRAIIANVVQKVPITANVMVTIVNVVTFQQIPV